jgi:hypothetical protein
MSDSPEVFPCIPSDQFKALKTNTYHITVNISGIINTSLFPIMKWSVSNSITPQKILLTYPILIEVIPIVAPMIICKIRRVFALIEIISS